MFFRKHRFIIIALIFSLFVITLTYLKFTSSESVDTAVQNTDMEDSASNSGAQLVRGLQSSDHILGNPNAPIIFYVYSDFGCSYCKDYHKTMRLLTRTYGHEGKMAWVFRHLPYVQLHPEAPMYALATECVTQELGNNAFWNLSNLLFEEGDPLDPFTAAELVALAERVGADRKTFVSCMKSNELMARVEKDFQEGMDAGAKGTPYTVVETPEGRSVYQGAQPFKVLAAALQDAVRSFGVTEIAPPTENEALETKYMNDFDLLLSSTTSETEVSTSSTAKPSILDGIITE